MAITSTPGRDVASRAGIACGAVGATRARVETRLALAATLARVGSGSSRAILALVALTERVLARSAINASTVVVEFLSSLASAVVVGTSL